MIWPFVTSSLVQRGRYDRNGKAIKHPQTGVYYLRGQIPIVIRDAFDHRSLHKASLGTKSLRQATVLFLQAKADLENKSEEARDRLRRTGSAGRSARDRADEMVSSYFLRPPLSEGGVAGPERLLLARTEIDRGLWNQTEHGCATPVDFKVEHCSLGERFGSTRTAASAIGG